MKNKTIMTSEEFSSPENGSSRKNKANGESSGKEAKPTSSPLASKPTGDNTEQQPQRRRRKNHHGEHPLPDVESKSKETMDFSTTPVGISTASEVGPPHNIEIATENDTNQRTAPSNGNINDSVQFDPIIATSDLISGSVKRRHRVASDKTPVPEIDEPDRPKDIANEQLPRQYDEVTGSDTSQISEDNVRFQSARRDKPQETRQDYSPTNNSGWTIHNQLKDQKPHDTTPNYQSDWYTSPTSYYHETNNSSHSLRAPPSISSLSYMPDSPTTVQSLLLHLTQLIAHSLDKSLLFVTPPGTPPIIWHYVHVRRLATELNLLCVGVFKDGCEKRCRKTRKISNRLFTGLPKNTASNDSDDQGITVECTAMEYCWNCLSVAEQVCSDLGVTPDLAHLANHLSHHVLAQVYKRLMTIFDHAWFHHNQLFLAFERENQSYSRGVEMGLRWGMLGGRTPLIPFGKINDQQLGREWVELVDEGEEELTGLRELMGNSPGRGTGHHHRNGDLQYHTGPGGGIGKERGHHRGLLIEESPEMSEFEYLSEVDMAMAAGSGGGEA